MKCCSSRESNSSLEIKEKIQGMSTKFPYTFMMIAKWQRGMLRRSMAHMYSHTYAYNTIIPACVYNKLNGVEQGCPGGFSLRQFRGSCHDVTYVSPTADVLIRLTKHTCPTYVYMYIYKCMYGQLT